MTAPLTAARQVTFCADPADSVSETSIRKGNLELPIIDDLHVSCSGERNQISRPSSADTSSPIYGSRSALRRFNEECRTQRLKPPSIVDDSSEFDILSDVGLAGDSDSEVVPIVTSLSISAKRKLRKEPRIKVPNSKLDNAEPTIQEETTQDILETTSPAKDATTQEIVGNRPRQIRSKTIIVNKTHAIHSEKNDGASLLKLPSDHTVIRLHKCVDGDAEVRRNQSGGKVVRLSETKDNPVFEYEPESSLCESDWHPKISERSEDPRAEKGRYKPTNENEDRTVISQKYDTEIKPALKHNLIQNKCEPSTKENHTTRPRSSGDERKRLQDEKLPVRRRISEHTSPFRTTVPANKPDTSPTTLDTYSRPKSSQVHKSETPIISEFFGDKIQVASSTKDNTNEGVSGIPKRKAYYSNNNTPREDYPSEHLNSGQENISNTPRGDFPSEFLNTPPQRVTVPPLNMETSDGYDYESETFEEILQERNAMVKAERTYQRRIRQLEEELKGMVNQCQSLSDENKELRKTIDDFKKRDNAAAKPDQDPEDTVRLATRIARLETEKENLVKENEKLSTPREMDSKKKQNDLVFVENTRLKNKNSELEKKVCTLESELETVSNKLKDVNTDNTGKSSVAEFKLRELEVALSGQVNENRNLSEKVKSLENDNKNISTILDEKRTELNEVLRAMQNETAAESDLKHSKQRLESAQSEIDSVKQELSDMRKSLEQSEENKEKLRNTLSKRDSEVKRAKSDKEHKDRVIVDLRQSLEKAKDEIQRHQDDQNQSKEHEKDTNALKSRIGSLKVEIESSLQENQRLKKEREEVSYELNRLRNENAAASEAFSDSKRFFRKWENEREARNKVEVELAHKNDEVESLDSRVKDGGNKLNVLYSRLRSLEDDRVRYKGPNGQELETNNKVLHDENKKLRQMLVERNIELTNKDNEKERMHSRIDVLERKQKDSEVRVRQLSGWVSDSQTHDGDGSKRDQQRAKEHLPPRHHRGQSSNMSASQPGQRLADPQIAFVSPRSRKKGVKRNTHHSLTPPPGWEKSNHHHAESEHSNHTPMSLPLIDSKTCTPPDHNAGYFQLYKDKLRRIQERRS